jgi:hypothetical protein
MRDMSGFSLPDVAKHFAAHLAPPRLAVGEDAARGRQNGDAQSSHNTGYTLGVDIDTHPRTADTAEACDDGIPLGRVAEVNADLPLTFVVYEVVLLDVALGLEDLGDLELELGGRDQHMVEMGRVGVPDSGEHIGNRVGDRHASLSYQLDFVIPGREARWAISRKQMRHSPKRRM